MDIEVRVEEFKKYVLQVGDIVYDVNLGWGTVIKTREGYSVRENGKEYEYLGAYETIEELDYEVRDRNFKIYSKDEYKLVLERK